MIVVANFVSVRRPKCSKSTAVGLKTKTGESKKEGIIFFDFSVLISRMTRKLRLKRRSQRSFKFTIAAVNIIIL